MAKTFLNIYVGINILIVCFNIIANLITGNTVQMLSYEDWMLFIIACSVLAVCETLESNKDLKEDGSI